MAHRGRSQQGYADHLGQESSVTVILDGGGESQDLTNRMAMAMAVTQTIAATSRIIRLVTCPAMLLSLAVSGTTIPMTVRS